MASSSHRSRRVSVVVRAYQILDVSVHPSVATGPSRSGLTRSWTSPIKTQERSFRVTNVALLRDASSDLGLAPYSISAANQELFFLYNCTNLQAHPLPPEWVPVNCTDGSSVSTMFNTFAWLAGGYNPNDKWMPMQGGCKVSMMPVLGNAGADYQRLMKGGFLLDYMKVDCTACQESGGFCRVNTTYDIFECHCSNSVSQSTPMR